MNRVLRAIINIPNSPFLICAMVYILYNLFKHTSLTELTMIDLEESDELIELKDKIYPNHFRYFVAIISYTSLLIYLFL